MNQYFNLILTVGASAFFGILIGIIYRVSHSRAVYSKGMQVALLVYTVIPAMMLFLDFHKGGIALIGAITIMRFREPVKDHRDLMYILWSVASGFACAAHQFVLLGICSFIVIIVLCILGAWGPPFKKTGCWDTLFVIVDYLLCVNASRSLPDNKIIGISFYNIRCADNDKGNGVFCF